MASEKKFWKDEPKIVDEFEKGSKITKALIGKTADGKFCAALQTFYTKNGEEKPGKGWFMVATEKTDVYDQICDSINALEQLKEALKDVR